MSRRIRARLSGVLTMGLSLALSGGASAVMDVDKAASHFGQHPAVWGMRLSPDGQRVSFLKVHPDGFPIALVIDLRTGKGGLILASDTKKHMDLMSCLWANDKRLLCSYYGLVPHLSDFYQTTRLVAVDQDGSNAEVLAQRQQRGQWAFHQADVIDLLPDDPDHILMPIVEDYGQGVSRVDINKNKVRTVVRPKRSVWGFWSDGRGNPRLRQDFDRTHTDLQYRLAGEDEWHALHRVDPDDLEDRYWPIGFGDDPNTLFVWGTHEGRRSIFAEKLAEDGTQKSLVYSHPEVDLGRYLSLGKYDRPVGVTYSTDRPHVQYFDETIRKVDERIRETLGAVILTFLDESWDRRFYLVRASTDIHGGTYYRFDTETGELAKITEQHPWLAKEPLAPMTPVQFPSDDGKTIPGYLTRSSEAGSKPLPTVILPHGGPSARDEWGFDWLAQFLAARGYAVLQANYRGSGGYGSDWLGEGAFKEWKRAMADIEYGARYLVEQGIADPQRICTVGWSYGGYAALMSAIEYPTRYRCVVSVAGVTNPVDLVDDAYGLERRALKAFIGRDPEVIAEGSPVRRAAEIQVPVLLVHAEKDVNVPFNHGVEMRKALEKNDKSVVFVEYEDDDHQIRNQPNRIDMLQKIGDFLDDHLRAPPAPAAVPAAAAPAP